MADEDKEKAEKLAAAKKRFEQLKKEQQKKGKKANKKKDDKTVDIKAEEKTEDPAEDEALAEQAVDVEAVAQDDGDGPEKTSVSEQSKRRSESFRQGTGPQAEVQELYRKQAARIEELEKDNKSLKEQSEESATRLSKAEEELDSLRESSSDMAEQRSKAKDADRLRSELASVQRQLAQAQQQAASSAKGGRPRSGTTPDLDAQLASKTSTIESLELEISNLHNQLTTLQTTLSDAQTSSADLLSRTEAAETATAAAEQELTALKVSISFPGTDSTHADPESLTKRITLLESDLRTANSSLATASSLATSLQQKISALTKLHKDSVVLGTTKDRELADLRAQLRKHTDQKQRASHVRDASEFELGEEETEMGALQAKIRALEAENFDLRRGAWREKRAELQPGMEDEGPGYEDVDLSNPGGPYSPGGGPGARGGAGQRQTSTFQDVITSGINAFTGRPSVGAANTVRQRAESMGLLSDDEGFDEDAFRQAQEEEAKRRIERIKEVKRGLDQWKGWRVDIADLRRNGLGPGKDVGPVFEV